MNSQIVSVGVTEKQKYPVLKRTTVPVGCGWDYVVLFTAPRQGVVVHVFEEGPRTPPGMEQCMCRDPLVGVYSENWGEFDSFSKFYDIVQLFN